MENSYVTLELKTYNEMYEKAKKFDEKFNKVKSLSENDNKNEYKFGDEVLIKEVIAEIDKDDKKRAYYIETENEFFWTSKNEIYKKEDK